MNGNLNKSVFSEFVGEQVKVPYRDGVIVKIARGTLVEIGQGFVKIAGELGTIVINEKNIEKMAKVKQTND